MLQLLLRFSLFLDSTLHWHPGEEVLTKYSLLAEHESLTHELKHGY